MKVLLIVTSHGVLGNTGKKTGYYLPEVTHPYYELQKSDFEVVIASPMGGKAPMDQNSYDMTDKINHDFIENPKSAVKLYTTKMLAEIDPKEYAAVIFAGGHGTMWDFPESTEIKNIASEIYQRGGVVAAVCHGPAALVNVRLKDGSYLIAGKRVTAFTNAEENAVELSKVMPFPLETRMIERGAKFESAPLWQSNVVVDERLVTGQNPASAGEVGKAVVRLLLRR